MQVAELTPDARKFLLLKFKDADTDRDQLLSPEELQHLWSTAPDRCTCSPSRNLLDPYGDEGGGFDVQT